ncbi:MAG: hypothetical protein EXQ94_04860 [Alphaproteobacteria bacterium]|nr:hypothetical protein [Alphaproteobacteria bacterium]
MAEPIGRVGTVAGTATATHADGRVATLAAGDPIYQGDALATGVGAALAVVFVDGTSFALGADARMIVDEFVYDPVGNGDSAAINLVEGLFVFVSGEVAHSGPEAMVLTTPVATIGIRGTALALKVAGGWRGEPLRLVAGPQRRGGRGGDDVIGGDIGEEGDDRMFGGGADDVLTGGKGNDVLAGGGGNDRMTGGTGSTDRFLFESLADGIFVAAP